MNSDTSIHKAKQFHFAITTGVVLWTVILFGLYSWALSGEREHFNETVKLKAESLARHTQALRSWIGEHGGVYVEVNGDIKPHHLLSHVPERDVMTPTGRQLTLLNSPAVLRQISNEFESVGGDQVRLVSLQPMNTNNIPDEWEKEGLNKLESGVEMVQDFMHKGEQSLFRLMYPMKLTPMCLKCHEYPPGEERKVVGALSVIVDKTPYDNLRKQVVHKITTGYLGVWIIGIVGLLLFDVAGARMLRKIEDTATHDGLTGLINRGEVERVLSQECERAGRYDVPLCVLMMDIDHFKSVNDSYGHQAGDEVLRVVASLIKETVRKCDHAGRYGGEEFIVIAPNTSIDGAVILAERLNKAVKQQAIKLKDGRAISVTVSAGVSSYDQEIKIPELAVKSADEALYQAKESGRDRVCVSG